MPTATKEGKTYKIHHVAFIEKINYSEWTVDIVESNGSEWVTKSTIDVNAWATTTETYRSELYAGHIDYDKLTAKAA
jgi:hypothetical protein